MTGRLLATCPSSHSWSVIPTLTDWGYPLSAQRRHALVLDDLAIKVVLRLDNAAKEHLAVHAGVVRLYAVVVIVSGWVRVGCARLSSVHS